MLNFPRMNEVFPMQRRKSCSRFWFRSFLLSLLISFVQVARANVAYPGVWTGLQPDGSTTGTEQVLVGTGEYHYAVVETEESFYPTIRDRKGNIHYASMGRDGRYLPTNVPVDNENPEENPFLQRDIHENRHIIHAKCMEQDYCRWRMQQRALEHFRQPLATSGSLLNLVIPFQFQDHEISGRSIIEVSEMDNYLFNGETFSVKDYFFEQSYGTMELNSELAPWVTIPFTERQCADGESGLTHSLHTCLQIALEKASEFFSDWDTVLQSATTVTFVHSGYAAEYGGSDEDGAWYEDRIWSHAWELDSSAYKGRYALISDKYDRKNAHINRVGAAVHEVALALGAPAMYGDYPGYGLGYFDMLANPWGWDGTLIHCSSMSPYSKGFFGWVEIQDITLDGYYSLENSAEGRIVYRIKRGFPEGEYLLIENRQEEGYDMGLSQPGLAIYHIDTMANNLGGYPEQPHFPEDHYVVALVQADGRYDLERREDEGDLGDLFHAGRFKGLGPDGATLRDGRTVPHPNTNSYQGGVEQQTGVTISDIGPSNPTMTFRVTFS